MRTKRKRETKKGGDAASLQPSCCEQSDVAGTYETEGTTALAGIVCCLLSATGLAVSASRLSICGPDLCSHANNKTTFAAPTMAKARVSLQRQAEQIDVHEDDLKEEDLNSELGESMDPLDESGHTVNSSDEEVEDAVAEDMARFEESFAGITKRFRLINRIGEGKSPKLRLPYAISHDGSLQCR